METLGCTSTRRKAKEETTNFLLYAIKRSKRKCKKHGKHILSQKHKMKSKIENGRRYILFNEKDSTQRQGARTWRPQ